MADKAPYKLTLKLSSDRPDAIGSALARLKELISEYDLAGESTGTITVEAWKEAPLNAIRENFEIWLHHYQIGIDCEVTQKAPGLRPETVLALRALKATPMDRAGWGNDDDED